jgi:hypothetical protein
MLMFNQLQSLEKITQWWSHYVTMATWKARNNVSDEHVVEESAISALPLLALIAVGVSRVRVIQRASLLIFLDRDGVRVGKHEMEPPGD